MICPIDDFRSGWDGPGGPGGPDHNFDIIRKAISRYSGLTISDPG